MGNVVFEPNCTELTYEELTCEELT